MRTPSCFCEALESRTLFSVPSYMVNHHVVSKTPSSAKATVVPLAVATAKSAVTPAAASTTDSSSIFLKIDGIEGSSKDSRHLKEIDVSSFSFGVYNYGSSRGYAMDLMVQKSVDKATPKLFVASANGTHINTAVLTVRMGGGYKLENEIYKFTDLTVSSDQMSKSAGSPTIETVSIAYTKVDIAYSPIKNDGSLDAAVRGGFDFRSHMKV